MFYNIVGVTEFSNGKFFIRKDNGEKVEVKNYFNCKIPIGIRAMASPVLDDKSDLIYYFSVIDV